MTYCEQKRPTTAFEETRCGHERGFTLIEVMIVIVIVGVLLAVAAPGFSNLIGNNRMVSELYLLRSTLNNARSEAMARRTPVVVCPTTDGATCADSDDWSTGYFSYVDSDDPNDPVDEIIQLETEARSVNMVFNNAARQIRFGSQGIALNFAGTITLCDDRGVEDARGLIVNPVGTVRAATDNDSPEDSIVDNEDGTNVVCN